MVQQGHIEKHFTATDTVRDIVIGMSDGLTVPFALAAGVSGAVAITKVVVTAGLAEIAAGSIAMGLGGFLAARTDYEHFSTEEKREWDETISDPQIEKQEVEAIFKSYGVPQQHLPTIIDALSKDRDKWVDFMMQFELGTGKARPQPRQEKRPDHRPFLHCRWVDPTQPLHIAQRPAYCFTGLNRCHAGSAIFIWLFQRQIHRPEPIKKWRPDPAGRWPGRLCCLCPGKTDWMRYAYP